MKLNAMRWVPLTAILLLAGCSGMQEKPGGQAPVEDLSAVDGPGRQAGSGADGARAGGADMGGRFAGTPLEVLDDPQSPLSKRVFYFEYDSSEVRAADRDALAAHAEFLGAHPELSVVVEGHTDERGTREYNLALGERRAQAVEKLLLLQGATRDQLQVISFGEERPVAMGHDEAAWKLNRRVELLYSGY